MTDAKTRWVCSEKETRSQAQKADSNLAYHNRNDADGMAKAGIHSEKLRNDKTEHAIKPRSPKKHTRRNEAEGTHATNWHDQNQDNFSMRRRFSSMLLTSDGGAGDC